MRRRRTVPSGAGYGWPLKPFDQPHPVRGYFNDPRISGTSRAFHFGVDVAGPDGTPVFAVEGGRVHLEGKRSLSVVASGGRTFGYWHVVPAVEHHVHVDGHHLLGHIEAGWEHVHFAETSRGGYRNPLRPGAMGPWIDPTSPRIAGIAFVRAGTQRELSPLEVSGAVDVVVEAWDRPPLLPAPPWDDIAVTPALLRWRVLRGREIVRPSHAPVDFRRTLLPPSLFRVVYAPGTRQNKPNQRGRYRFYVAHGWSTGRLRNGLYRLEVSAADAHGNRAVAGLPFTVANRR
jgi:hypothetical protein